MIWIELINMAALAYGGVTDYKRREIPNAVPQVLLAAGILRWQNLLLRLLLMLAVAGILWLTGRLTKQTLPGGDFKLLCALSFSVGLLPLLGTLLGVGIGSLCVSAILGKPLRRSIPLCSYVAPAYAVIMALLLIFA